MPKMNCDAIPDAEDFSPLPAGEYLCTLNKVAKGITGNQDEKWDMEFIVMGGEYAGKRIIDTLYFFSEGVLKRAKLICSRLGLDMTGEVDLQPADIEGRIVYVTADMSEYTNKEGVKVPCNKVPFAGYRKTVKDDDPNMDAREPDDVTADDINFGS